MDGENILRLLIIDDEQEHLRNLQEMLQRRVQYGGRTPGFRGEERVEVSTFSRPEELDQFVTHIQNLQTIPYHLIISDVVMPLQTGGQLSSEGGALKVYRALKNRIEKEPDVAKRTMLVVTTAKHDVMNIQIKINEDQRILEIPWAIFLTKPADVSTASLQNPSSNVGRHEEESWTFLIATAITRYRDMRWREFLRKRWYDINAISTLYQSALIDLNRYASQRIILLISSEASIREQMAQSWHELSGRKGTFQSLNCSHESDKLLASRLFGHEKDVEAGFASAHRGIFGQSRREDQDGTVFLDEFASLPDRFQLLVKHLSSFVVTDTPSYKTVGGTTDIPYKGGLILGIKNKKDFEGSFNSPEIRKFIKTIRPYSIEIPSLCNRKEDIIPLAEYLLIKHFGNSPNRVLSEDAQNLLTSNALLISNTWPENESDMEDLFEWLALHHSKQVISGPDIKRYFDKMGFDISTIGLSADSNPQNVSVSHDDIKAQEITSLRAKVTEEVNRLWGFIKAMSYAYKLNSMRNGIIMSVERCDSEHCLNNALHLLSQVAKSRNDYEKLLRECEELFSPWSDI